MAEFIDKAVFWFFWAAAIYGVGIFVIGGIMGLIENSNGPRRR